MLTTLKHNSFVVSSFKILIKGGGGGTYLVCIFGCDVFLVKANGVFCIVLIRLWNEIPLIDVFGANNNYFYLNLYFRFPIRSA